MTVSEPLIWGPFFSGHPVLENGHAGGAAALLEGADGGGHHDGVGGVLGRLGGLLGLDHLLGRRLGGCGVRHDDSWRWSRDGEL